MKLLFYIDTMAKGGAQRVMLNLISYFCKNSEVILVNDVDYTKEQTYFVENTIKRYFLESKRINNKILRNILRINGLRKIINKENPDLSISFLKGPNVRLLLANKQKNKSVISIRNNPINECGSNKIFNYFLFKIYKKASGIVFQTNDAKNYFPQYLQSKSRVIYNPINDSFFDVEDNFERHDIVTFGRLEPQKNQMLLIDSFSKIHKLFPNEKLFIYGCGSLKNDLSKYIEKLGLSDFILLCGVTSNVKEILLKSKVFVLSSDYEGIPNALLEAYACGTPCVSTDCPCGGPREIIENGCGILTECNNSEQLADAIRKILSNMEFSNRISENAKTSALRFKSDKICKEWENFFKDLI